MSNKYLRSNVSATNLADLLIVQQSALSEAYGLLAVCRPSSSARGPIKEIDIARRQIEETQRALVEYMVSAEAPYLVNYRIDRGGSKLSESGENIRQLTSDRINVADAASVIDYSRNLLRHSRVLMSSLPGDPTGEPDLD